MKNDLIYYEETKDFFAISEDAQRERKPLDVRNKSRAGPLKSKASKWKINHDPVGFCISAISPKENMRDLLSALLFLSKLIYYKLCEIGASSKQICIKFIIIMLSGSPSSPTASRSPKRCAST